MLDMMKIIIVVKYEVKALKSVYPTTPKTSNIQYVRKDITKYCWTYGTGNHFSKDDKKCRRGHKEDATFSDNMGGFKAY